MSEFKRQHPIAAVTKVLAAVKQNFVTIVVLLFIGSSRAEGYFLYLLLGGLVLTLLSGIFSWWKFLYRIQQGELQIQKGVFVKSNLYLSKDRIQVIDITEGILQRIFGLVQLEVKTAGGGTETATISALSRAEAEALRKELRSEIKKEIAEEELRFERDVQADEEIIETWKLSGKDLVFAAFTSGNFGLIASILGAISGQMQEFINEETIEYLYEIMPGYSNVTMIISVIVAIIVISWVLSFLGVIFRYADFRLHKKSTELIISSGLLERKHITVPFDRIQAVRFVEGVIRQPFGYGMVYVESAGFDQTQQARSIVLAPFMASSEVSTFLTEFLEEFQEPDFDIHPPKNSFWRYIRRTNYILIPAIPAAWLLFDYGWLAALFIPMLAYLGWLQYQDAALALGEKTMRLRHRTLGRVTAIIKRNRIQNVETSQNPFQKRKNLQHVSVTAASGAGGISFQIKDIGEDDSLRAMEWILKESNHPENKDAVKNYLD